MIQALDALPVLNKFLLILGDLLSFLCNTTCMNLKILNPIKKLLSLCIVYKGT